MLIKAYAKINISLDVVGKREDGYHYLKMIMQTIDLYDLISFNIIKEGIKITCNKPYVPVDDRNLVYKAAKLCMETFNIRSGIEINLKKNIPVSAGLAGGSTDAAATLKAIKSLFNIDIEDSEFLKLALKLGADVPFCMNGGTALCEGIGEIITPLPHFENHILVLVKPNFGVPTKEVYQNLDITKIFRHPNTEAIMKAMEEDDLKFVSDNMKNVLENVTLKKHRILREIKSEMLEMGAMGALMSGSGPTVFSFFEDMLKAQYCYDKLKYKYREVFITRTI